MVEYLSVSEVEEEAKRIKRGLEGWREIILPVSSLLLWEKSASPGIIFGIVSAIFLYLWQSDPNLLTIISVLGLIITGVDYLVPTLSLYFCHPERWTSAQERKLESICRSLAANKIYMVNCLRSFCQMRRSRPSCYYSIVITSLLILSFIGHVVNNLFLTYLTVMALLLLPGMQHHGIIQKFIVYVRHVISEYTRNTKAE